MIPATRPPSVERLVPAIEASPLQVGLFDLELARFGEMSQSTAALFQERRSLDELLDDPEASLRAIKLLRDGTVGGYQAHRRYHLPDGTVRDADVWLQTVDSLLPHRWALFIAAFEDGDGPTVRHARPGPMGPMVLGTIGGGCKIEFVSTDIERLSGQAPASYSGRAVLEFIHEDDHSRIELAAAVAQREGHAVCTHVRAHIVESDWTFMHILIASVSSNEEEHFAFVASEDPHPLAAAEPLRTAELEHRLWRIAREIQAAGLAMRASELPAAAALPHYSDLSTRQLEVLHRIARGERVAQIAAAMYLSKSTVRNHLAEIFKKFGVHSQAQLMERLRQSHR